MHETHMRFATFQEPTEQPPAVDQLIGSTDPQCHGGYLLVIPCRSAWRVPFITGDMIDVRMWILGSAIVILVFIPIVTTILTVPLLVLH